jgi:prepilin-type processing-associated H-X9-DG protein
MRNEIQSGTAGASHARRAFFGKIGEIPPAASACSEAFTCIELLVVLGVIALLAAVTLPGLTQAKQRAQGAYCLNNQKQLMMGWKMYAEDNNGRLVPNHDAGVTSSNRSWVLGWEDWTPDRFDNTNFAYLSNTLIFPYVKSVSAYKCPGDIYRCSIVGQQMARVRSVSMNGQIEGGAYDMSGISHWGNNRALGYMAYNKLTDIVRPAPVDLFVFVEEHADSINDGWMLTDFSRPSTWEDLPASYHDGACGISFADGHAEMHKWRDSSTRITVKKAHPHMNGVVNVAWGEGTDLAWLKSHAGAQR